MTLFEILKSRGLATDDDLKPFFALVEQSAGTTPAVLRWHDL